MSGAVYNSAIPRAILNTLRQAARTALAFSCVIQIFLFIVAVVLALAVRASAVEWNVPEQSLAQKILAVTGPGAAALTMENRSSLTQRDRGIIQNGIHDELEKLGLRFVNADQAAASVKVTLSENASQYVWVAEIRQGADGSVVMVAMPRMPGSAAAGDAAPLSLRKIPLWLADDPILDVAVLEESAAPTYIAVLTAEKVALYRLQVGKWQEEQTFALPRHLPQPRDLRGRLVPAADHLLDVYLPGKVCRITAPTAITCRESDDPWPLIAGGLGASAMQSRPNVPAQSATFANGNGMVAPLRAFFAPNRNFFTGVLTPSLGKFSTVPKFYSAAALPRDKYTLWLFATTDGQVHMIDGISDQTARLSWGSDVASVKTSCGAGWQVLATSPAEQTGDSIRAYEFPDRDPVAVSAPVDFAGPVTALWTETRGDTTVVVVRDLGTGSYEAFRLAVACNQ